jgi:hypothetical protein
MRTTSFTRPALLAVAAITALSSLAPAVITIGPRSILSSADYLAGARGQYIGRWGAYIGTPIGPRHFITASHVGDGGGGGTLYYNNGTPTQTAYQATWVGSQDDLAVWQLTPSSPSFTLWAPLYTASDEVGKGLTVIGRGTDKGAEVRLPAGSGQLRGWQWGASDGQVTGGTNTITSIYTIDGQPGLDGDYLYFEFDQNAGPTECIYSVGDSSGAVFIVDPADGLMKVAGVNSLVDGNFSYSQTGTYFPAAIWDARGFWVGSSGSDGQYINPALYPNPVPAGSYATRVSSRMDFIRAVVPPTPTCGSPDFNCDGDVGTDADIEAFFACLGGHCPAAPCMNNADFNGDGDVGTDADIEAFFRVLAGGPC